MRRRRRAAAAAEGLCSQLLRWVFVKLLGRVRRVGALHQSFREEQPVVFSVGIGKDISFDTSVVHNHTNARVFCFDPTLNATQFGILKGAAVVKGELDRKWRWVQLDGGRWVQWPVNTTSRLSFHPHGLGGTDRLVRFYHHIDPNITSLTATPGLPNYETAPQITAAMFGPPALRRRSKEAPAVARAQDGHRVRSRSAIHRLLEAPPAEACRWRARVVVVLGCREGGRRWFRRVISKRCCRRHAASMTKDEPHRQSQQLPPNRSAIHRLLARVQTVYLDTIGGAPGQPHSLSEEVRGAHVQQALDAEARDAAPASRVLTQSTPSSG